MNNPLHILQTLDCHLTKPAEITTFGRAALALGFPNSPAAFATTHDVDAFTRARVPDVAEIQELFRAAQPKVLAMLPTPG